MSYIIIFVLLIAGVSMWQFNQSRRHQFILSKQIFPELNLVVLVSKKKRKIHEIIIHVDAKKEITINGIKCELISKKRTFSYIDLSAISPPMSFPVLITAKAGYHVGFLFDHFKEIVKSKPMHTFRMVVETGNNKVFKSHELALNKYWNVYKADTGKYN